MVRSCFYVFYLWVGFLTPSAFAASDWFPDRLSVAGHELVQNGKGTRFVLFFSAYECALYLAAPTGDAARVIGEDVPVSIRVEVLGDGIDSMPDAWKHHLRQQIDAHVFEKLRDVYDDLDEGDRIELVYMPGRGSWVDLNGERTVRTGNRDLMRAVLMQWIGDDPVSLSLKHALLNTEQPDAFRGDDW